MGKLRTMTAERAERRAMIALAVVFAMLVQAFIPALASAATVHDGQQVICTEMGLKTVQVGDQAPAKQAPAAPCEHCVCPPVAAQPPELTLPVALVAYTRAAPPEAADSDLPPPARAPPRPPGQGPPTANT